MQHEAQSSQPKESGANRRELTAAQIKSQPEWQDSLWRKWPRDELWPGRLKIYEAAAYLRVHPDVLRGAVNLSRSGRARLRHQRLGATIRISRTDLDSFGAVKGHGN